MHPVADWLGDADRIADLGRRLCGASVPADRLALYRRTLHPEILGRATLWMPGRPVEIYDRAHGLDLSGGFCGSPLDRTIGQGSACALDSAELDTAGWGWAAPLRGLGLRILLLRPLRPDAALAIGTCRANGFTKADLQAIGTSMRSPQTARFGKNRISQ
jgi:adenylate cyclase